MLGIRWGRELSILDSEVSENGSSRSSCSRLLTLELSTARSLATRAAVSLPAEGTGSLPVSRPSKTATSASNL